MNNKSIDWWRTATIYQIYPKSFCDSGCRGTGDIQGIIAQLDYLKLLGVEALWLTPVYSSPMIDNGYDISDYYNINADFGTMADFDQLLVEMKKRDLRLIMDIVVNHTSTQHAWFQSALGDKQSPYRDYYIWKDAVNGQAPTNWESKFGGNAWQLDTASNQYYLHLFAKEQADLNWENPQVREEVKNVISFWAEKGVDGFRLDVINLISKPTDYQSDERGDGRRFYTDGPQVHQYLQEISEAVFNQYGSVTVGEMSSTTLEHCQQYSAQDGKELSMVFNFHHLKIDYENGEKWSKAPFDFIELKSIFNYWQQGLHNNGWAALFWCNHDQPRIVSRLGCEQRYRVESAKMLASSLHMMQGTPYIYQGEEIGMTNPGYTAIEQYRDVESTNNYSILVNEKGISPSLALDILAQKSRDNARTPMQWDNSEHAGFSKATPWIGIADNVAEINVKRAVADENSVFHYYRQLIKLRKELDIVTSGDFTDLMPDDLQLFCYQRKSSKQTLISINNFYDKQVECSLPDSVNATKGTYLLSNYDYCLQEKVSNKMHLQPYECRILLIDN